MRKTQTSATAALLSAVLLFTSCAAAVTDETALHGTHNILNSASALDSGDDTYLLDDEGSLILLSPNGESRTVADIRALSFTMDGDGYLTYSGMDGAIRRYRLADGKTKTLYDGRLASGAFSKHGDEIWFVGEDALYRLSKSGKVTKELELDGLAELDMQSGDEILLYADNPAYIQEFPGDETDFEENNDQYLTYLYSTESHTLSPYEENLEDAGQDPILQDGTLVANPLSSSSPTINGVSYPFADYPVDSFFTKNGKSCTCHNQNICVESGPNCNCMRYWPTGVKSTCQVDLLSSQCMGFARFCMWRTYGYFDAGSGSSKCYNVFGGQLTSGKWSANILKNYFTSAGPGGHLRTGSGHSLYVISVSSTGFITYEANKSKTGSNCIVYTRTWTWDSFYSTYSSRGLVYYNIPSDNNFTPPSTEMKPGMYQVLASTLNMRSGPSTSYKILTTIPNGTPVAVTEITLTGSTYWGKTSYNGYEGWISMDYAVLIADIERIKVTSPPNKTTYFIGDKFDTSGMVVTAYLTDGTSLEIEGYSCSGYNMNAAGTYTVKVTIGSYSDSFQITVRSKAVYPTSIKLDRTLLVAVERDVTLLNATLLPSDTTQRTIKWTSSNPSVASVDGGKITALKAGETTITATTENNLTASVKVVVIKMPTGTEWSVTASGDPLPALPDGIESQDYSLRYQMKNTDGSWSDWIYGDIPANPAREIRCQFRYFTLTLISDGKEVETPRVIDVNTTVNLESHQLEKDGYLFAGWFTTNQAALRLDRSYAAAAKITVTGDLTLYAGWIPLDEVAPDVDDPFGHSDSPFTIVGSALKADADSVGIRFFTRISTSLLSNLSKLHKDNGSMTPASYNQTGIGYGTILIRKSAQSGDLLKPSTSASYLRDGKAIIVPGVNSYAVYNGYLVYDAYVTGFLQGDYETDYLARPYLTYKDANGFTHTYYPPYDGENAASGGIYNNLKALADSAYAEADFITRRIIEEYIYAIFEKD